MEQWKDIWQQIRASAFEPIRHFIEPQERVFVLYLGSGLLCALIVFALARRRDPAGTPRRLFDYLFPRRIYLHPSAIADYKFFLVDRILSFLAVPYFVVLSVTIAGPCFSLLEAMFGTATAPILHPGFATTLVITLGSVLAIDLALWWIHYLHHRIPVLWEFHKVHHSAEVMTPLTAYRMHPVEVILNLNLTGIVAGVTFAIFQYLTANSVTMFLVAGVDIISFLFYVIGFNLRHSHIPMAYPRVLSFLFVSPWMHQVHHSLEKRHLDRNMGFIFAFWDWLFGTLYIPKPGETFAIGLDSGEAPKFHKLHALYLLPFRNIVARLSDGAAAKSSSKAP